MYVSTLYQKRVSLSIITVCLYVVYIDCLVLSIIMYVRMCICKIIVSMNPMTYEF